MSLETPPLQASLATAHPSYPFSTKHFVCIVLLCSISWRAAALRSVSPSFKLRHHSWLLLGAFHICTPITGETEHCTTIVRCTPITGSTKQYYTVHTTHWLNNTHMVIHICTPIADNTKHCLMIVQTITGETKLCTSILRWTNHKTLVIQNNIWAFSRNFLNLLFLVLTAGNYE